MILNKRELDVLDILWHSDIPMTSIEIAMYGTGLSQSTVQSVLRKLLKSGYVQVSGITHSGKTISRQYTPTPDSQAAILESLADTYSHFSALFPKEAVIASLYDSQKISLSELDQLNHELQKFDGDDL